MAECIQSGYRWCSEDGYCSSGVCVNPKIYWQFEDAYGNDVWDTYPYAVGGLYLKSGYSGNSVKGYGFYNASSWDDIWNRFWCDNSGCHINREDYDFTPSNGGRIILADVGERFTKCLTLVAYDWNTDGNSWASKGTGIGFIGTGNCVDILVVEEGAGVVRGQVTDAISGLLLSGVSVTISGKSTSTDSNGSYSFFFGTDAKLPATFELAGYQTQSFLIQGSASSAVTINVQLEPIPPPCQCTEWKNKECISDTQRKQTRTCNPSGCDIEERTIDDPSCTPPPCECTSWINRGCVSDTQRRQIRTCNPPRCNEEERIIDDPSCYTPPKKFPIWTLGLVAIPLIYFVTKKDKFK